MTDDDVQSSSVPIEATPATATEVVASTPADPITPSTEPPPVVEQVASADQPSVIPEESQTPQEIPVDSRTVSPLPQTVHVSKAPGRKWNADDRAKSAATHARKRDAHLAKILEYAKVHGGKIANDEIEKLLHVSDATASRYAKILVQRGVLRQEGEGRGVKYVAS